MEEMQRFDAWGMVSVEKEMITVIMSCMRSDGKSVSRTVQKKSPHELGFSGSALVAAELNGKVQGVHEIGDKQIMGHPDVEAVFKSALDWIKASI